MNVDAAVKNFDDHAGDASTEKCAMAVRLVIEAGGTVINPILATRRITVHI